MTLVTASHYCFPAIIDKSPGDGLDQVASVTRLS
jgi:hypothetical protein